MTQKEMAMLAQGTFAKGRSWAFRRPRDAKDNPDWEEVMRTLVGSARSPPYLRSRSAKGSAGAFSPAIRDHRMVEHRGRRSCRAA
jgi:hypothetical protein